MLGLSPLRDVITPGAERPRSAEALPAVPASNNGGGMSMAGIPRDDGFLFREQKTAGGIVEGLDGAHRGRQPFAQQRSTHGCQG